MGKHKKKKKELVIPAMKFDCMEISNKSKKKLEKDFKHAINDIRDMRMSLYEADKKVNRKKRKAINKEEAEFYSDIAAIKARKSMAKEWEKKGFLDHIMDLLQSVSPLLKTLAKLVATLVIAFISIDGIKKVIKPSTLAKLAKIFDIAMAV